MAGDPSERSDIKVNYDEIIMNKIQTHTLFLLTKAWLVKYISEQEEEGGGISASFKMQY